MRDKNQRTPPRVFEMEKAFIPYEEPAWQSGKSAPTEDLDYGLGLDIGVCNNPIVWKRPGVGKEHGG